MKSLNSYKRLENTLMTKVHYAEQDVMGADHDYNENPNEITLNAYTKANTIWNSLYNQLSAVRDIISNYDFYKFCFEEEESQADRTKIHLSLIYK